MSLTTADKIRATEHAVETGQKRLLAAVDALAAEHRRLQRDRGLLERLRKRQHLEKLGVSQEDIDKADAEITSDDDE